MRQLDELPEPDEQPATVDNQFEAMWEAMGESMAKMGIETGFVACVDPETGSTRMFFRGHFYDATRVVSSCADKMRGQVKDELF